MIFSNCFRLTILKKTTMFFKQCFCWKAGTSLVPLFIHKLTFCCGPLLPWRYYMYKACLWLKWLTSLQFWMDKWVCILNSLLQVFLLSWNVEKHSTNVRQRFESSSGMSQGTYSLATVNATSWSSVCSPTRLYIVKWWLNLRGCPSPLRRPSWISLTELDIR